MVKSILDKLFRSSVSRAKKEHLVPSPVEIPGELSRQAPERKEAFERAIILGVLLRQVACADSRFLPEEEKAIQNILRKRGNLSPQEAGLAIAAAREAASKRPDIQGFTREVNKHPYGERVRVVELLFQVAFADKELSVVELEAVRQISRLLWVEHKDFINAKLKVKRSLGLSNS